MNRKKAHEIVRNAGLSDMPEYYSGRGAILEDLNSITLEKIYREIDASFGNRASDSFVRMVADIPKLSATDFLISLYSLEANGWEYKKENISAERGIYATNYVSAQITVCTVLSGMYDKDSTEDIRKPFLLKHGKRNIVE